MSKHNMLVYYYFDLLISCFIIRVLIVFARSIGRSKLTTQIWVRMVRLNTLYTRPVIQSQSYFRLTDPPASYTSKVHWIVKR